MVKKITSGKLGLFGAICSALFFLIFLTLGFIQPNYNHFRDPISVLVSGEFGWIQEVNFVLLMFSLTFIVLGLFYKVIKLRVIAIRTISFACIIDFIIILFFPAVRPPGAGKLSLVSLPLKGKIHYFSVLALLLLLTSLIYLLIQEFKKSVEWKKFVSFSYLNLTFNLIFGLFWFIVSGSNYNFLWTGLLQKIVVTNFLAWLGVVGYRLWVVEFE